MVFHDPDGTLVIVDLTNNDTIPNMPMGQTEVLFTVVDECGNIGTRTENLLVEDKIPPIALCYDTTGMNTEIPPIHLSVTNDGTAKIFVEDIDYGSFDNCGIQAVRIRRLGGCLATSTWSDEASFDCCDEPFNPVILELGAFDFAGNLHTCKREVYVEDPIAPILLDCPVNDTIYCEDAAIAERPFSKSLNLLIIVKYFLIMKPSQILTRVAKSGTIQRIWTASDLSDKSPDTQCSQTIIVNPQF